MLKNRLAAFFLGAAANAATVPVSEFEGIKIMFIRILPVFPRIYDGYTHSVQMGDYKTNAPCAQLLQSGL